jgi:TldD protein
MKKISRRSFLHSGAGALAVLTLPKFLRPGDALAAPAPPRSLASCLNHFGVSETTIRKTMAAALSKGGDYCDLFFEHKLSSYVMLEDDSVNRAYTSVDLGVGIRVVEGDQTGFSFTESLDPAAMVNAARTAANIARGPKVAVPAGFTVGKRADYYPIETSWESVGVKRRIPLLEGVNRRVQELDARVVKSRVTLSDETIYTLFLDSEGKAAFDFRPLTRLYSSVTAERNGQREQGGYNLSARDGIEFYTPERLERLAKKAVERTVTLFDAVKPDAGEREVVLAAGSSGILLHEAIGHGMEADFNRKDTSVFADKMNKPVAENFVSIVDDGLQPNQRGSLNVDDEGNPTEKTYLVRDGKLRSYMHDRISARHYKVKPTGSGRRESFRHVPLPRMRNTYMENGPHKTEEIIRSVKSGVFVESFRNGQVNIGPGDYTFYVATGNIIENGKLGAPIKDVNLIGSGPDSLSKITMVADDMAIDEGGWVCGKAGQSVPVSLGMPTVKVSAITVGGKGA